jgi:hypothetical protein
MNARPWSSPVVSRDVHDLADPSPPGFRSRRCIVARTSKGNESELLDQSVKTFQTFVQMINGDPDPLRKIPLVQKCVVFFFRPIDHVRNDRKIEGRMMSPGFDKVLVTGPVEFDSLFPCGKCPVVQGKRRTKIRNHRKNVRSCEGNENVAAFCKFHVVEDRPGSCNPVIMDHSCFPFGSSSGKVSSLIASSKVWKILFE